jgi:hypothetical protein
MMQAIGAYAKDVHVVPVLVLDSDTGMEELR